MRILITGGTGFIGKPTISLLERAGHEILLLTRRSDHQISGSSRIKIITANLADKSTYQNEIVKFQPELLIHLAWDGIPDYSTVISLENLKNSVELITNCISQKSFKKIIVSGSCFEIPSPAGEIMHVNQFGVKDPFTWAKYSLYLWIKQICEKSNINFLWLRLFYVYGPGQRSGSLIPHILNTLKKECTLPAIKTPRNKNDFIYVDDVATLLMGASEKIVPSGIFNVGSGKSTSILDICKISEMLVLNSEKLSLAMEKALLQSPINDDVNFWANIDKLESAFSWTPSVELSDGIKRVWESLNE